MNLAVFPKENPESKSSMSLITLQVKGSNINDDTSTNDNPMAIPALPWAATVVEVA